MKHDVVTELASGNVLLALGFVVVRKAQLDEAIDFAVCQLAKRQSDPFYGDVSHADCDRQKLDVLKTLIVNSQLGQRDKAMLRILHREATALYESWKQTMSAPIGVAAFVEDKNSKSHSGSANTIEHDDQKIEHETFQLGHAMLRLQIWLSYPFSIESNETRHPHPDWEDDNSFPWPEAFEGTIGKLGRQNANSHF